MSYLKYISGAVGLSLVLMLAGCASSDSASNTNSALTESVSEAETELSAESETKDSTSTEAELDTSAYEGTVDESGNVSDSSAQIRESAAKGSLETFSGKYQVADTEGIYYYFGEDGVCYYVQEGTYSFEHDLNTDNEEADMIVMQFKTQENGSYYTIQNEDGDVSLRITYSGDESETTIPMTSLVGDDAITGMEPFEGIYAAYNLLEYRYEFHADGTFYLVLEESYEVGDGTVTISAFGKDLTYDYAADGDAMVLSSEGTEIATLTPAE